MKRYLSLLLMFLALGIVKVYSQSETELLEICNNMSGGATFQKDFTAKLDQGAAPQKAAVILKTGMKYRFSICSSKDYAGEAKLDVYDTNRILVSTYVAASGKNYPYVDFICNKTGVYHVFISFIDGKEGLAVGILSFVEVN